MKYRPGWRLRWPCANLWQSREHRLQIPDKAGCASTAGYAGRPTKSLLSSCEPSLISRIGKIQPGQGDHWPIRKTRLPGHHPALELFNAQSTGKREFLLAM